MKRLQYKIELGARLFAAGFKSQVKDEHTLSLAGIIGLYQGLKYKGSIKTGAFTTAAVLGAAGVYNGTITVAKNWSLIKSM